MDEEFIPPQVNDEEFITPESITKECINASGYMLFAAIVTNKRDLQGNQIIDFKYQRNHFHPEDLEIALQGLKRSIKDDIIQISNKISEN